MQTEQDILNQYQTFEASQYYAELQRMREYLCQELQEYILNSIFTSGRGRMPSSVSHHQYSNACVNGAVNTTTYPPTAAGVVGASNPHPEEFQHHVEYCSFCWRS